MAEFSDMIPTASQGIANVIVAVVIGLVGAYGYYRKFRGDDSSHAPAADAQLDTLKQIAAANNKAVEFLDRITDMIEDRIHREELDREYQRGRDAQIAEAAAGKIAATLKAKIAHKSPPPEN